MYNILRIKDIFLTDSLHYSQLGNGESESLNFLLNKVDRIASDKYDRVHTSTFIISLKGNSNL
jgi:hypothetical protein